MQESLSESKSQPAKAAKRKPRWRKFKEGLQDRVNDVFLRAEPQGRIKPIPAFLRDYSDYPELRILEENYPTIRSECVRLLAHREEITDIRRLGGGYTAGGIHTIAWKSFVLHAGGFIPENCALCPGTASLLRRIPGLYTAFFSILEPHQYIRPHWGYYKGFLRYHLGIVIPRNNADRKCWLRINIDPADNAAREIERVANGETYYWHDGEGVFFDDVWLHDAANESDEVRVVLWIDIHRRMPWKLRLFSRLCLAAARLDPAVRSIRKAAVVRLSGSLPER